MRDNILYARLAHYAFASMLPLAEKIGEEGLTLHETGLPWLINYGDYTRSSQQLLEQLADFHSYLWRPRLVLMWDYLPSCREMAFTHCRAIINQVTARLQDWIQHPDAIHIEWVRRMHKEQMATFRQQLDQARWLF